MQVHAEDKALAAIKVPGETEGTGLPAAITAQCLRKPQQ